MGKKRFQSRGPENRSESPKDLPSAKEIVALIEGEGSRPFGMRSLAKTFRVPRNLIREFEAFLDALAAEGRLKRLKGKKYQSQTGDRSQRSDGRPDRGFRRDRDHGR